METIAKYADSWLGLLGSVGLLLVTYVARKYVIPYLQVGHRQRYASFIAAIADEVTDELRSKYPEKEWLAHLDEAVDKLMEICGVTQEVARRAVQASVSRK